MDQKRNEIKKMPPANFRGFRIALIALSLTGFLILEEQGAFETMTAGGFFILVAAYTAIAFLLYRFIASKPDLYEQLFERDH